jgi:hypothetical protein
MRASTGATSILFGLMIGHGFCQIDQLRVPSPEVVAAEDFFVQVAASLRSILVNGQVIMPTRPTVQESIGLTAQEAKVLTSIAAEYESKNRSYYEAYVPLRREALFQSIESGTIPEELERRIQDLQNEHTQMVLAQKQKLKTELGDSRFHAVEAFLYSEKFSFPKKK